MTSQLNTKINTYTIERGIAFEEAYSLSPTRTGSNANGSWALTGTAPVYGSSGPVGGNGSWKFITSGTPTTFRSTSASEYAGLSDNDFTIGIWFKVDALPTDSSSTSMQILQCGTAGGIFIAGTGSPTPGKLSAFHGGSPYVFSTAAVTTGVWHYAVIRKIGVTGQSFSLYLDNVLQGTGSAIARTATYTNFGGGTGSTGSGPLYLSNFHYGSTTNLTTTAISEIYTAGTSIDKTITATPLTATALQTEPTIAITAADHTEITTSIVATAQLQTNISIIAAQNINNIVTTVLTASAIIGDNIEVDAATSNSFSSDVMTASADIIQLSSIVFPLSATAEIITPTLNITPNYFNLIKSKNPIIYIPTGDTPGWNLTSPNYGSWTEISTQRFGTTTVASAAPMNLVGVGNSSQFANTSGDKYISGTFDQQNIDDLITSRNFTFEYWTWIGGQFITYPDYAAEINMKNLNIDYSGWYKSGSVWYDRQQFVIKFGTNKTVTANATNIAQRNTWNHIVLKVTPDTDGKLTYYFYVNGTIVSSGLLTAPTWSTASNNIIRWERNDLSVIPDANNPTPKIDEIAVYNYPLSNSEIITNYNFINTLSPNRTIYVDNITVSAISGSHNFLTTSNVNYPESSVTGSAVIVNPSIIASRTINISADVATASAQNIDPVIHWGWTIYSTPAIATGESKQGFVLNDVYYNYVMSRLSPYRYVTFDAQNEYLDYGTDTDYAVEPVVVGGTVVSPQYGINGKSAKTAGISYINDGVILKESEYDDTWGTDGNRYHSSFWMQKAEDDTSTTGLRIIWNLNSHYDNQHVILYQYQNKLHMQFNNKSGDVIYQSTTSNVNLFDGNRNFVIIDFTTSNKHVDLYVNATNVMTVDLDSYDIQIVNDTVYSEPNDEENNYPRLSIGSLITPFSATALPLLPTNTKMYVDEIIWAKTGMTQTLATQLLNAMPGKDNMTYTTQVLTASEEFVLPSLSISSSISAIKATATSELVNPSISADFEIITNATVMTANMLIVHPQIFENRTVIADVFIATAIFNSAGAIITRSWPTMYATAQLQTSKPYYDMYNALILTQSLMPLGTSFYGRWGIGDLDS